MFASINNVFVLKFFVLRSNRFWSGKKGCGPRNMFLTSVLIHFVVHNRKDPNLFHCD